MSVEVYIRDRNRRTIGMTTSFESLDLSQRRCDFGQWTLVTRSADDAEMLRRSSPGYAAGPRGVIIKNHGVTVDSGWANLQVDTVHTEGRTEYTIRGFTDTVLMADTECRPKPDAPITAQSDAYDVRSGPASNRIRDYLIANTANRLGILGVAGGNQLNLGPIGTSRARNIGLLELAQGIAGRSLNFQIRQRDSDGLLFLYQWVPVDRRADVVFSPATGTVHGWSHTSTPAEATRVVIGAGGEGAARGFREYVNLTEEDLWAGVRKIERFKDRRDLDIANPQPGDDWETEAGTDAAEFLNEAASRATFTLDATGTGYALGRDVVVGDLVRAYRGLDGNGQPIGLVDDLLQEGHTTWTKESERTRFRVGSYDDLRLAARIEKVLRQIGRRISAVEARR